MESFERLAEDRVRRDQLFSHSRELVRRMSESFDGAGDPAVLRLQTAVDARTARSSATSTSRTREP